MNRQPFEKPPQWWAPKMSPAWIRFWRPFRLRKQVRQQRLLNIDIQGLEHVRSALDQGQGVLITPNHSSHADCYSIYAAADRLGCPLHVMIAWQNFVRDGWFHRTVLRQHGGFSIDREGTDLSAFRQAVEILQNRPNPLFIFPEGEVYHINDRITPFREGPAAIALAAAKKADRPVVCVPCAIKYRYVEDPTPELLKVMEELERAAFWRPRPDLTLPERIYRFAEAMLSIKEIEYLGATQSGPLPERLHAMLDTILGRIEDRYGIEAGESTVPERVKALRQEAIKRMTDLDETDAGRKAYEDDLDDIFLVVQGFSYPGDYVSEQPSVERIAETLDKFEEDFLGRQTARIRGTRRATITFGEPIPVSAERKKGAAKTLTHTLEQRVQGLLAVDC